MTQDTISIRQLNAMLLIFMIANFNVFEPRFVAAAAGSESLLSVALGTLFGLLVAGLVLYLGLRFGQTDVMQYSVSLLGARAGHVVGALYLFILLFASARPTAKVGLIGKAAFGWHALTVVVILLIIVAAGVLARRGLATIAPLSEYAAVLGIVLVLVVGATTVGRVNWSSYTFLAAGWGPAFQGAMALLSRFSMSYVLLFLLPRTRDAVHATASVLGTVLVVGLLLVVGAFEVGMYGAGATAASFIPALQQVSDSIFGRSQGLFNLAVLLWMLGLAIKTTIAYWLLSTALAQTSGEPAPRFLVPAGAATYLLAVLLVNNAGETFIFLRDYYRWAGFATGIAIPLLLLLVAWVRRRQTVQTAPQS